MPNERPSFGCQIMMLSRMSLIMLPRTTQGMISIKTLSKLAQLRHEGVMLVRDQSPFSRLLARSAS